VSSAMPAVVAPPGEPLAALPCHQCLAARFGLDPRSPRLRGRHLPPIRRSESERDRAAKPLLTRNPRTGNAWQGNNPVYRR
jgi:hypothetical protein